MFEPMRITAHLQCGIISDPLLPIDAVLYYQAFREANGGRDVTLPGEARGGREGRMWLKVLNGGTREWYFAASSAQWQGTVAEGSDHWNKRFDQQHADIVDFGGKRGKVIVEAATYKAYHMPVFYRHALSVAWYVVGDRNWAQRMLSMVTHLGKKTSQGFGAVLSWDVQPFRHDWSVFGPRGELMRPVPDPDGVLVGFRPSYWLPRNQARCRMPTTQAPC